MKAYPISKLIERADFISIDGERHIPVVNCSKTGRINSIGFCEDGDYFGDAEWILVNPKADAYLIGGCVNVQAYRPDLGVSEAEQLTLELGMIRPLTDADMEG